MLEIITDEKGITLTDGSSVKLRALGEVDFNRIDSTIILFNKANRTVLASMQLDAFTLNGETLTVDNADEKLKEFFFLDESSGGGELPPDLEEKLNAIVTDGNGTMYLCDDGTYKAVSGGSDLPTGTNTQFLYNSSGTPVWQSPMTLANINARETVGRTIPANILAANFLRGSVYYSGTSIVAQYPSSSFIMYQGQNYQFNSNVFGSVNGLSIEDNSFNGPLGEFIDQGYTDIKAGSEIIYQGEIAAEEGRVPDGNIEIEFSDGTIFSINEMEVRYNNMLLYDFQNNIGYGMQVFPQDVTINSFNRGTSEPNYWLKLANLLVPDGKIILGNQSIKSTIESKGIPTATVLNSNNTQSERPLLVDYSFEEQFTGRYWIDGKKIYQITLQVNALPSSDFIDIPISISNVDKFIDISGFFGNPTTGNYIPVNFPSTVSANYNITTQMKTKSILTISVGNTNRSAYTDNYVTLHYTCTDR